MKPAASAPLAVNGWALFAHPLFLAQVEALLARVEALRDRDPIGYTRKNATKRLAAIAKLIFEVIPQDPARPEYRQGSSLGDDRRHWFRAGFFQQYRLFFRYHQASRIIVYAWVNDEDTRHAYESSDDVYRVFQKMLESGHPPEGWDSLLAQAKRETNRLRTIVGRARRA